MTVNIQNIKVEYTANGKTSEFSFNFRVVLAKDLVVTINKERVSDVDYSLTGVGNSNGGVVTFNTAPNEGDTVVIYREVVLERYTDYQRNGDFLAKTVNEDFDRLMMVGQDGRAALDRGLQHDILGEDYDAQGRKIENLANPEKDTDVTNKQYVDTYAMVRGDTEGDTPLNAKGLRIINVADALEDTDVASKGFVDDTVNKRIVDINSFSQSVADTLYVPLNGGVPAKELSLKDNDGNLKLSAENGDLKINDVSVNEIISTTAAHAVGDKIWHFSRDLIEDGQVALDGQLLNRADYTELFNNLSPIAISDEDWLADPKKRGLPTLGDGSTSFRLPDLNGKQEGSILSPFLRGDGKRDAGTIAKHALDKNLRGEIYIDKNVSGTALTYQAVGMAKIKEKIIDKNTAHYSNSGSSLKQTWVEIDAKNIGDVDDDTHPNEVSVVWCIVAKGRTKQVINNGEIPTLTGTNKFEGLNDFREVKQNGNAVIDTSMCAAYATETFLSEDGLSGYEKWSNGKIVQWGVVNSKNSNNKIIINLLISFSTTKYVALGIDNTMLTSQGHVGIDTKEVNKITFKISTESIEMSWYAVGY